MPSGEDVGNERQYCECRGSQSGCLWRVSKSIKTMVLVNLLVSLLTTSLATPVSAQDDYTIAIGQDKVFTYQPTSLATPVSAQDDYTVTIGQEKVFTDCNSHYAKFDDFPYIEPLPWPDPDDREAYSTDNTAYVSMLATPGHAARADSWIGVYFDWDLGPYTREEVEGMPVDVTLDFYYQICGDGYGWAGQGAAAVVFKGWSDDPTEWYDVIGSDPDDVGCRSNTVTETYTTTVGELGGWQWILADCLAYSMPEPQSNRTYYSSAEVQVNRIKIEFVYGVLIDEENSDKWVDPLSNDFNENTAEILYEITPDDFSGERYMKIRDSEGNNYTWDHGSISISGGEGSVYWNGKVKKFIYTPVLCYIINIAYL